MARWECKPVDKLEPLSCEPVSDDILGVISAEVAKVFGVDDASLPPARFHFTRPEPAMGDPRFDRFRANMECHGQGVLGKAVLAHLGVCAKPLQHVPDRT